MLEGKTTFWQKFLQTFDNDGDAQSTLIFAIRMWISLTREESLVSAGIKDDMLFRNMFCLYRDKKKQQQQQQTKN